uniref:Uncharacterized protein n=1 Tax=Cannabis sativa TaxID=3483 RepID=A0A803Q438_CANSA
MGSLMEIGVRMRKLAIVSIKACFRSVKYHPFLVGMVLFLMFMYRSFPFLFSLFLSASPVLVCTAILLGTLLSFGQSNIPEIEIEKEEKLTHDVGSLRAVGVSGNGTIVVDKDESFIIERYVEDDREGVGVGVKSFDDERVRVELETDVDSLDRVPLIDESSREIHSEIKGEIEEEDEREFVDFQFEMKKETFEEELRVEGGLSDEKGVENEYSLVQDLGDEILLKEFAKSLEESLSAHKEDHLELESSSPGGGGDDDDKADEETTQAPLISHDESDGASEDSHHSGDKDDEKNLMDLGTSELERNQRLENLIARRRARKSFRLLAEKNLIDLDSVDLPFNVAPISTARQNPFDAPFDSYDHMGLPPIPGSAPSILLPRRNPFDLPYDSSEEKPDLKGDNFEQEFLPFHQKDMFRRYESFSMGPSGLGNSRQEKQNIKWKPVFVPERMASEGTSYHPSFQRQSSELSESKLSSVPDTDSVSSLADADEKRLIIEHDFSKEELLSTIYQASDLLERGSRSSEDVESVDMAQASQRDIQHDDDEAKDDLGEVEDHHEMDSNVSERGEAAAHVEPEQVGREDYSSGSSLSSLSEVDEPITDMKNEDDSPSFGVISAEPSLEENQNKDPVYDISPPTAERLLSLSSVSSDLQVEMSEVINPPTSVENVVLFESRESPVCEEMDSYSPKVDAGDEIPLDSGEVLASSGEPEVINEERQIPHEHDNAFLSNRDVEIPIAVLQDEDVKLDTTVALSDQISLEDLVATPQLEHQSSTVAEQASVCSNLSSLESESFVEQPVVQEEMVHLDQDQIQLDFSSERSLVEEETFKDEVIQHVIEQSSMIHPCSSENDHKLDHPTQEEEITQVEQDQLHSSSADANNAGQVKDFDVMVASSKTDYEDTASVEKSPSELETQQPVDEECAGGDHGIIDEPAVIVEKTNEEDSSVEDKVSTNLPSETSDSAAIPADILEYKPFSSEIDLKNGILDGTDNDNNTRLLVEEYVKEEVDEIKDIDEELLSELDTVGDFSVKEFDEPPLPTKLMLEQANVGNTSPELIETSPVLPVLEARSLDDIDLAFKQLHEGADVEEVILPSVIEEQKIMEELKSSVETTSELEVVEARSLDDIHTALKQVSESSPGENKSETASNEQVIEARSLDDIQASVELPPTPLNSENKSAEVGVNEASSLEIASNVQVVEARSLDDIHMASDELPATPLNSENKSAEVGVNQATSLETASNVQVIEARSLDDIHMASDELPATPSILRINQLKLDEFLETASNDQVIEARSLDDIHMASNELPTPTPSNSENKSAEVGVNESSSLETASNVQVIEARSSDDIHMASDELPTPTPSNSENILAEVGVNESSSLETASNVQVVEPRSLDDIHTALKPVSESSSDELPTPLHSENKSAEVVSSSTEMEPDNVATGVKEGSSNAADEPKHESSVSADEPPNAMTDETKDKSIPHVEILIL